MGVGLLHIKLTKHIEQERKDKLEKKRAKEKNCGNGSRRKSRKESGREKTSRFF